MLQLIVILIAFFSVTARAQELVKDFFPEPDKTNVRYIFNPLVSVQARTLPPGRMGFQKAGGANVNSSMLTNALSIGILPRFELGVVPVFYVTAPGSINFTGKINIFKGEELDAALSYSRTKFKSEIKEEGKIVETPDLVLNSYQLGFNYHPEDQDFIVSPSASNVCGYIDSSDSMTFVKSLKCELEWGVDLQWRIKDREWVTFAYGHLREAGLSPYESMHSGAGVAYSQFRPSEIFSRPSIGIYVTPATGETLYLISTTFYEM